MKPFPEMSQNNLLAVHDMLKENHKCLIIDQSINSMKTIVLNSNFNCLVCEKRF